MKTKCTLFLLNILTTINILHGMDTIPFSTYEHDITALKNELRSWQFDSPERETTPKTDPTFERPINEALRIEVAKKCLNNLTEIINDKSGPKDSDLAYEIHGILLCINYIFDCDWLTLYEHYPTELISPLDHALRQGNNISEEVIMTFYNHVTDMNKKTVEMKLRCFRIYIPEPKPKANDVTQPPNQLLDALLATKNSNPAKKDTPWCCPCPML